MVVRRWLSARGTRVQRPGQVVGPSGRMMFSTSESSRFPGVRAESGEGSREAGALWSRQLSP